MEYKITDEIIVEEYLNNWFSYEELAQYLCISLEEVKNVLDNKKGIIDKYGNNKFDKIRKHTLNIYRYSYDNRDEEMLSYEDKKILDIADYIIYNKASIRETAKHFSYGKSTIYDYINERLPIISIKKYKLVFDVLMSNKSFSTNNKKVIEQVLEVYKLLMSGISCEEIGTRLNISRNVIQRDLTTRLRKIDIEKALYAEYKLINNQYNPLEENSFKAKK